ncbi:acyltransferase family protein [Flavobacterium notoginsengisoli]|uniref:acyltransferase family protein n=1 Tax=Flavobacterium notoginsengisoli TaxID=1478199 RepID=UPI00363CACD7
MTEDNKVYFPNLNSLRGVAAIMVIISHLQHNQNKFSKALSNFGNIGVTIFFVLSGFLISYLLLVEKEKFSKINTRDFYFRRVLRIWPLYFLMLFFVYTIVPFIAPKYYISEMERFSIKSLLMNVFFLTNVTLILKLTPLIIRVIWSIGIEEQFYLILPWIMKIKEQLRIKIVLFIILFLPLCKLFLILFEKITGNNSLQTLSSIITVTRFDCMAIGVFFGVLAFYKQFFLGKRCIKYEFFTKREIQLTVYILIVILFLIGAVIRSLFNIINYIIFPWLFAICIINLATNNKSIFKIENKILNYLGKISYGLYLVHELVIFLLMPLFMPFLKDFLPFFKNSIIYIGVFGLTILISHLLYYGYEIQFLKLKRKVSHIITENKF